MKKFLPIVFFVVVIAAAWILDRGLQALRADASLTFNFYPVVITGAFGSLVLAVLIAGSFAYLWNHSTGGRLAAWVYLLGGLGLFILPMLAFIPPAAPLLPVKTVQVLLPWQYGGLTAALCAAAGFIHLLRGWRAIDG